MRTAYLKSSNIHQMFNQNEPLYTDLTFEVEKLDQNNKGRS